MARQVPDAAKQKFEEIIDQAFEKTAGEMLGYIPGNQKKTIIFSSKRPSYTLADLFVKGMQNKAPNDVERDALKGLIRIAYSYISGLKERTKANILNEIDAIIRKGDGKGGPASAKSVELAIKVEMNKAKTHMKTIAEAESTKARNVGAAMDITRVGASMGLKDPNCFFVVKRDEFTCKHCIANHLRLDGTPKVFKLSEVSTSYLTSEDRKSGKVSCAGQHPHCFTGDQKIMTSEGIFTFKELFDLQKPVLATVDNRVKNRKFPANQFGVDIPGTLRYNRHDSGTRFLPTTPVYDTGVQNCFKFTLASGHTIVVSEDHEMWVDIKSGGIKKKAKEIKIGDILPLLSGQSGFGSDHFPDEAELMGNLMGDGNINKSTAVWCFFGDDLPYGFKLAEIAEKITGNRMGRRVFAPNKKYSVSYYKFNSANLRRKFVDDFGFSKKPRIVPVRVWKATKETTAAFLRGLYAADGHVEKQSIVLSQNDPKLLGEIQLLLMNFGIKSRIFKHGDLCQKKITYANGDSFDTKRKPCWRLHINSIESRQIFQKEIGFGVPVKNQRLSSSLECANKDKTRFEWRTARVTKIECLGNQQTYCLTEPSVNTITVNGIVTGQCRCSLVMIPPGWGFKEGKLAWIGLGYDAYSDN